MKTIGKHVANARREELADWSTVAKFATVQQEGDRVVERYIEHYNLVRRRNLSHSSSCSRSRASRTSSRVSALQPVLPRLRTRPATAVTDYPVARTDVCGPSGDVSVTVADIVAASGM